MFWGIGVGPGPAGYLPLAALDALARADIIYAPRARGVDASVALRCLDGIEIAAHKLRDIEFNMDPDRSVLSAHYAQLADSIADELKAGCNVAYLTIGDSLTYSTYGYVLAALRARLPGLPQRTFPGITSYAAAASALSWPLGEGKERVLILPCPETSEELRREIETHDIVVLMKIGPRLDWVLALLRVMEIDHLCAFARRIGLPGELLCDGVGDMVAEQAMGYLATMLVRRHPRKER
ncbi:precorrin-2 C(20)-methyltransferase [Oxalobacteraceae bacterium]|nr:precorrin-2 C(20)-methyltransferase [Oxalobacteraceae bacterium]